eukprot:COSAG06_NODE_3539_length_5209_cov_18.158513_5_plen_207_part_00
MPACQTKECVCPGHDRCLTRLDTVKQLFHAFSNRSQAYAFNHSIGLITFGSFSSTQTFDCEITDLFERFKDDVDQAEGKGRTYLWDALHAAYLALKDFQSTNDQCRLRMLVLSDGADTGSHVCTAHKVARLMQDDQIIVDAVAVGKEETFLDLKAVCHATGGCCFRPDSIESALRLFERETVLKIRARELATSEDCRGPVRAEAGG